MCIYLIKFCPFDAYTIANLICKKIRFSTRYEFNDFSELRNACKYLPSGLTDDQLNKACDLIRINLKDPRIVGSLEKLNNIGYTINPVKVIEKVTAATKDDESFRRCPPGRATRRRIVAGRRRVFSKNKVSLEKQAKRRRVI